MGGEQEVGPVPSVGGQPVEGLGQPVGGRIDEARMVVVAPDPIDYRRSRTDGRLGRFQVLAVPATRLVGGVGGGRPGQGPSDPSVAHGGHSVGQ